MPSNTFQRDDEDDALDLKVTPEQRQLLSLMVVAMRTALKDHNCRFNVPADSVDEIGHAVGMLKDVGKGSFSNGVEIIRENHKWLCSLRERTNKITLALVLVLLTTLAGGTLTAIWSGLKSALTGLPKP